MVTFPDGKVAYNRESAIDILSDYGIAEDDVIEFAELVLESELTTLHNQVDDARLKTIRSGNMNRITEKTLVSYSCGLWDIEVETDSGADIFRSVRIVPITSDVVQVYYGEHWASIASNDRAIAEWLESLD